MLYTLSEATNATLATLAKPSRSGAPNPTGAKVRPNSLETGTFEHRFWRRYEKGETDKLFKAAEKVANLIWQSKRHRRGEAPKPDYLGLPEQLTNSALRIFRVLCTLGRTCKGEIWPSFVWLAEQAHVGPATVARCLKQLEDAGFLVRQRRCERVMREGPGPRFEQASNAYRLTWPEKLTRWLGVKAAPVSAPDDYDHMRAEERRALIQMEKQAKRFAAKPSTAFTKLADGVMKDSLVDCDSPELLDRLARLALAIEERERDSHNDREPLQRDIFDKGNKRNRPSRPMN